MYLGSFLVSCVAFALLQVNGEKFMCPTCSKSGSDAVATCDKNIRLEECDSDENPRCMIEKYEFKNGNVRVNRMCTNKKRYEELIARCEIYGSCPLRGFCTESGCKASLPDMAEKFMCPTCSKSGSDAVATCDKNIRLEECDSDENPRCMIEKYEFKNGNVRVNRMCTNKKRYEELIARCEIYGSCPLRGFCTESGCKARLPDMAEKFMCPTCSASGSDAVASCDKNIRLEECDSDENPRCMIEKYEFKNGNVRVNRMCTNKKRYEELIARCEIYRSCPLRGFCTESGCKATFEG